VASALEAMTTAREIRLRLTAETGHISDINGGGKSEI
jgi:hypothetical protein